MRQSSLLVTLLAFEALLVGCGRARYDAVTTGGDPFGCYAAAQTLEPCVGDLCPRAIPVSIEVADLNADGHQDFVMGDMYTGLIAVHLGNGDGTFGTPASYQIRWDAVELGVADFDGDTQLDVVAASWNSATWYFKGTGSGALAEGVQLSTASNPWALQVVDLDGDGAQDLVSGGSSSKVSWNKNLGNDQFDPAVELMSVAECVSIAAGDFDGDGAIDVSSTDGTAALSVLFRGDDMISLFDATASVQGLAVGDWNRDGIDDLAAAEAGGVVELFLADGGRGFSRITLDVPPEPRALRVADLDRDGLADLVVVHESARRVSVLQGQADDAPFAAPRSIDLSAGSAGALTESIKVGLADFNEDGLLDIIVPDPVEEKLQLLLSDDSGACQ